MINNLDEFNRERKDGEFYFIQILLRKKDQPEWTIGLNWNNSVRCLRTYYIDSPEKLEKYKNEMIDICDMFNARLYMHPARRSKLNVALKCIGLLGEYIMKNNLERVPNLYTTACGSIMGSEKIWVVDVDSKDDLLLSEVRLAIGNTRPNKLPLQTLETKNGYHILCNPFDLSSWGFSDIDVHKNNPTILYVPNMK